MAPFLPLPKSATIAVLAAVAVGMSWLIWAAVQSPSMFWAPGDLSRFHADIHSCGTCHEPFRGAAASRCVACHSERSFARRASPAVAAMHHQFLLSKTGCGQCHTEHRGALAQITWAGWKNPHGEFVFTATGTSSCGDCHDVANPSAAPLPLLDNATVSRLFAEGEGAHVRGKIAQCLRCHRGGRLDIEEGGENEHEENGD